MVQWEQGMKTKGDQKYCSSDISTDPVILLHVRAETADSALKTLPDLTEPCDQQYNICTVQIMFYHQVPSFSATVC